MKVKTDFVPDECRYITEGKVYDVAPYDEEGALCEMESDDGKVDIIRIPGCAHIDGKAWEVVEE